MVLMAKRSSSLRGHIRAALILLTLGFIHIGAVFVPLIPVEPEIPADFGITAGQGAVLWEEIGQPAQTPADSHEQSVMDFLETALQAHRRISTSS